MYIKLIFALIIFAVLIWYYIFLKNKKYKLILMRHGQTEANVKDLINSNPGHPNYKPIFLTPQGILEVITTAHRLSKMGINKNNVAAVYVSPLPRTQQTAQILAQEGIVSSNVIHIDPRLTELQMGDREGHYRSEYPEFGIDHSHAHEYNGETDEDVYARVKNFYDEIKNKKFGGNVIVVSHGFPSREFIKIVKGIDTHLGIAKYVVLDKIN